ncbi:NfeD family protein [Thermoleptolyngbya sp.]|jgi:Membrane protein implicated in regulation of membrane protease activity
MMQSVFNQPAYLLWLVGGMCCLFLNLLVFEPTITALGIAAIITSIAALSLPSVGLQMMLWGILSVALAIVMRGMVPQSSKDLAAPSEAQVSVTIPRGGVGEVTYEGTIWSARSQVSDVAIAVGQTVHVVGRQGNTLIVLPAGFVQDSPVSNGFE